MPPSSARTRAHFWQPSVSDLFAGFPGFILQRAARAAGTIQLDSSLGRTVCPAQKHEISVDSAITIAARNIYERKSSLDMYIRPLVAQHLCDSLLSDTSYLNSNIENWQKLNETALKNTVKEKALEQIKNVKF